MPADLLGIGGCAWSLLEAAAVRPSHDCLAGACFGVLQRELMSAAADSPSSSACDELRQLGTAAFSGGDTPPQQAAGIAARDGHAASAACNIAVPAAATAAVVVASPTASPTAHRGGQHNQAVLMQPTSSPQELLLAHQMQQAGVQPQLQRQSSPLPPQLDAPDGYVDPSYVETADDLCLMLFYKVLPCNQLHSHSWNSCPYLHHGEKARRRSLLVHHYNAVICPDVRKKGGCPRGEGCPMTHSMFELHMHPQRFKTVMCKDGAGCQRPFCFFAHTAQELRPVADTLPIGMLALGQPDGSVDAAPTINNSSVQYSMASLCERLSSLASAAAAATASAAADSMRAPSPSGSSSSARAAPQLMPGQHAYVAAPGLPGGSALAQLSYIDMRPGLQQQGGAWQPNVQLQQFAPVAAETTMLAVPAGSSSMAFAMGGQVLPQDDMGSMHSFGSLSAADAHAALPVGSLSTPLGNTRMLVSVSSGSGHAFAYTSNSMDMFGSGAAQAAPLAPYSYMVQAGMQVAGPQQQQLLLQAAAGHAGWPAAALPPASSSIVPLLQLPVQQHAGCLADGLAAMGSSQVVAGQAPQVLMAPPRLAHGGPAEVAQHVASAPFGGQGQPGLAGGQLMVQQQMLQHMAAGARQQQQQQQQHGLVYDPLLCGS